MFRCPDYHDHRNSLTIHREIPTVIQVAPDESIEDAEHGDVEWDETTPAQCSCGWEGTVADMTVTEPEDGSDEARS